MHLLRSLILRDLKSRYFSSIGGLLWALAVPLALLAIYAFVFTQIFEVRFPAEAGTDFVPYLALGLWPWLAFAESVTRAATAITDNEALIGKVALPHGVLVQSSVCATFAIHVLGLGVVIVVLALSGVAFHWTGLHGLLWTLALAFVLAMGLAHVVAATQVFFRDLTHALGPLFMIWFFATPILYPLELVPEGIRPWMAVNPMTAVIRPIRDGLLAGSLDFGAADAVALLVASAVAAAGLWYFRRLSPHFEDFL